MGITAARPYIIDEFDSDDDVEYESSLEYERNVLLMSKDPVKPENRGATLLSTETQCDDHVTRQEAHETQTSDSAPLVAMKGLEELLKLLEEQDFEAAQRAAHLIKMSPSFSNNCITSGGPENIIAVSTPLSAKTFATSSWSSHADDEPPDKSSSDSSSPQQNNGAGDLTNEQRRALEKLDEELSQFEAIEQKIANEVPVYHSSIPRPKSTVVASAGNTGSSSDVSKKMYHPDRRRSPSPSGKLKSGIPRYSWAHVTPLQAPATPVESKTEEQTQTASCVSNQTLESLPELTDSIHTGISRRSLHKTFSTVKSSSTENLESNIGNESSSAAVKDEHHTWDLSMSDHTGRVRMIKKHSCLPSLWVKPEEAQRACRNLTEFGVSTSTSSNMNTDEIVACRTIGECGGLSERKVLDLRRWYCMSRPQYKSSCGVSAVVSCWNYLFSTMGHGSLKPVTQEAAMKLLGFQSPFDNINFGPVTGNITVLKWFNDLNVHFKVNGKSCILYKPSGKNQTLGVTDQMALKSLKKGLKDPNTAFIYHCHNHYFCPIGYEDTSQFCVDAYKADIGENADTWVLIGDTSRKYPSIHCISWEHICQDLNSKSPSYFNVRQTWKGVMQRKIIKSLGENLHCIMAFQRVHDNNLDSSSTVSSSSTKSSNPPSQSLSVSPTDIPGFRPALDACRPELGNDSRSSLEDEEVGCETLDSDKSDDNNADESFVVKNGGDESFVMKNDGDESFMVTSDEDDSSVIKNEGDESFVIKSDGDESFDIKDNI